MLSDRRFHGAVWAEDSEQLVNDFNQFKEDLSMETSNLICYLNDLPENEEHPGVEIYVEFPETDSDIARLRDTSIVVEIYWDRLDLNVRNADRELLQLIPGWNTAIQLRCNMLKWFNQYHSSGRRWSSVSRSGMGSNRTWSVRGRFAPPHDRMAHPYIGASRPGNWTNICMGDLTNGIADGLVKRDWISLYNLLAMWLSEYVVGYTGPLNSPNYMHLGMPKDWNPDYIDAVGIRTSWCMDQVMATSTEVLSFKRHSYCKEIECQMMTSCESFKNEEGRAEGIIKAIPNISELNEIETPFKGEQVDHIFNQLQLATTINETTSINFHILTANDWRWLIANKCLSLITNYFGFQEGWWDVEVPDNPNDNEEQERLQNEMITWAVSRNHNLPIQGDREQDVF